MEPSQYDDLRRRRLLRFDTNLVEPQGNGNLALPEGEANLALPEGDANLAVVARIEEAPSAQPVPAPQPSLVSSAVGLNNQNDSSVVSTITFNINIVINNSCDLGKSLHSVASMFADAGQRLHGGQGSCRISEFVSAPEVVARPASETGSGVSQSPDLSPTSEPDNEPAAPNVTSNSVGSSSSASCSTFRGFSLAGRESSTSNLSAEALDLDRPGPSGLSKSDKKTDNVVVLSSADEQSEAQSDDEDGEDQTANRSRRSLSLREAMAEIFRRERGKSAKRKLSDYVFTDSESNNTEAEDDPDMMPPKKKKKVSSNSKEGWHLKLDKFRARCNSQPQQQREPVADAPTVAVVRPVAAPPVAIVRPVAAAPLVPAVRTPVQPVARPVSPAYEELPPGICVVCADRPVTIQLLCKHAFCEPCIVRVKASPFKNCPRCRKAFRKWKPLYL